MDRSLLYVSESRLGVTEAAAEIDQIVAVSVSRNAILGVTGSLIATRHEFAQILEGPEAAVDELMASILADPRHANLRILEYVDISRRRFPNWTLAYSGPATYVVSLVEPLLETCTTGLDTAQIHELKSLMEEFGRRGR